jgi:hypothetical protein
MKITKFLLSLLVLAAVVNCSKITDKVEEKVNEKVNEKIDENLKKIDSSLDRRSIDSLMNKMDSIKLKADSIINESRKKLEKDN